tara:strand:- start:303 stop:1295 length:993 start_codon:yes stop_codon:yes gene_type:complete
MKKNIYIILVLMLYFSCTKEINISIPNTGSQFVVNGIIEKGETPKILLQRNLPYFEPINIDFFNIINTFDFVNDATITITNSYGEVDTLMNLGFPSLTDTWFYNYEGSILGEEGVSYKLEISKQDTLIWAVTTIPELDPFNKDSLRFLYRPDDSAYCFLQASVTDPDTLGNCYRLFSKTKSIWGSVVDFVPPNDQYDDFFISMLDNQGNYNDEYSNGWTFTVPMYKGRGFWQEWGQQENEGSDNSENVDGSSGATTGFWNIGDEVILKISAVDRASWDFWASLQYNNPGGPFGAPSQANTNVNGGLGVFGGSSSEKVYLIANPEVDQKFN